MTDWTDGYVADIGYTFGYYTELNPLRVRLAFLNAGLVCPDFGTACELGFGQGVSANFHAAASVTNWYGTDFNPGQAGLAQQLARASGAGAQLYDEAFSDFANRTDLPEFDYVGLHGIWSWISDENRAVITEFLRKKLKVGGVVYISYNTLPGINSIAPLRHLLTEHSDIVGAEGEGIVSRIEGSLDFTEKLFAIAPKIAEQTPKLASRLEKLKTADRHYLAHEYFNLDWKPMYFAGMVDYLSQAKVSFACSAHYLDHVETLNLTVEQEEFLNDIHDSTFKQTVRDYMVNQPFRKDYWVKGARSLSVLEKTEALRAQRLVLTTPRDDVELKVVGSLGEATLKESVYVPILDELADHKVHTIDQLAEAVKPFELAFEQVVQAVIVLTGAGHVTAVQDDGLVTQAKAHTDLINNHVMLKSRSGKEISFLVSPLTGGGIAASRFEQLFLLAIQRGNKTPEGWAEFVLQILLEQNQKIVKEGKALNTDAENLAELNIRASEFAEKRLLIMKALKIL